MEITVPLDNARMAAIYIYALTKRNQKQNDCSLLSDVTKLGEKKVSSDRIFLYNLSVPVSRVADDCKEIIFANFLPPFIHTDVSRSHRNIHRQPEIPRAPSRPQNARFVVFIIFRYSLYYLAGRLFDRNQLLIVRGTRRVARE